MNKEIWKIISGYNGRYSISNFGRVKSNSYIVYNHTGKFLKKEIIMKQAKNKKGYCRVGLINKNKKKNTHAVHRLVAQEFLENKNNYKEVNHIDENKENNRLENLEWCDRKYNVNYGNGNMKRILNTDYKAIGKKKSKPIIGICNKETKEFISISQASEFLNVSISAVSKCLHGKIKKVHGWSFVEKNKLK